MTSMPSEAVTHGIRVQVSTRYVREHVAAHPGQFLVRRNKAYKRTNSQIRVCFQEYAANTIPMDLFLSRIQHLANPSHVILSCTLSPSRLFRHISILLHLSVFKKSARWTFSISLRGYRSPGDSNCCHLVSTIVWNYFVIRLGDQCVLPQQQGITDRDTDLQLRAEGELRENGR